MSTIRQIASEERHKEAAVLYTAVADLVIVVPMFIFGFATLSLTLISEAVRVALMLVVEFYSYFVLRAVHRDRLRQFHFGIAKLEQFCNLVIGAALIASGFWIANHIVFTLLSGQATATPLGLAIAAVVNGVNTSINAQGFAAMLAAARVDDSLIFQAQLRARKVKLIASLIVQFTITIAALASDPFIALWFDGLGGAFVAALQFTIGLRMMAESLPDLLDHTIPGASNTQIANLLDAAGLAPGEISRVRTRRAGPRPQVEVTLAPVGCTSVDDFCRRAGEVQAKLEDGLGNVEVIIVVDTSAPSLVTP